MTLYTRLWQVVCVPLAAVGASLAFVKSPVAVTFLFTYFGALGMLLTLGFAGRVLGVLFGTSEAPLACGAVVGGSVGCFIIGLASVLGPGEFLLAVLVLAGSPYAMRSHSRPGVARRSRCRPGPWRAEAPASVRTSPLGPSGSSTLTDEQLCRLWRAATWRC